MAGFTELPSLGPTSLGTTAQDMIPFGGEPHRTSSRLINKMRDYLVAAGAALGLADGSTPGSITARVAALEAGGGGGKSPVQVIVGLASAGDLVGATCDFLDTGNGAGLWAACNAVAETGGVVQIRSQGVFDLTQPGAPAGYLFMNGVTLRGAGPGLTSVVMRNHGEMLHIATFNGVIEDVYFVAPIPTSTLTAGGPPCYIYAGSSDLRNVTLYGNGGDYAPGDFAKQTAQCALMVQPSFFFPGPSYLRSVKVNAFPYRAQHTEVYSDAFIGIFAGISGVGPTTELYMDDACSVTGCEAGVIAYKLTEGSEIAHVTVVDPFTAGISVTGSARVIVDRCNVVCGGPVWGGAELFDGIVLTPGTKPIVGARVTECRVSASAQLPGSRGISVRGESEDAVVHGCTVKWFDNAIGFPDATVDTIAGSIENCAMIHCNHAYDVPVGPDVIQPNNRVVAEGWA